MNIAGGDIYFLAGFGVVYMIVVFIIEHIKNPKSIFKCFAKEFKIPYEPKVYDDDV